MHVQRQIQLSVVGITRLRLASITLVVFVVVIGVVVVGTVKDPSECCGQVEFVARVVPIDKLPDLHRRHGTRRGPCVLLVRVPRRGTAERLFLLFAPRVDKVWLLCSETDEGVKVVGAHEVRGVLSQRVVQGDDVCDCVTRQLRGTERVGGDGGRVLCVNVAQCRLWQGLEAYAPAFKYETVEW